MITRMAMTLVVASALLPRSAKAEGGVDPKQDISHLTECHFFSGLSRTCHRFRASVLAERGMDSLSEEEDHVRICFEELKQFPDNAVHTARRMVVSGYTSEFANECYRLVTAHAGHRWRDQAEEEKEAAAAYHRRITEHRKLMASIDRQIRKHFKRRCGVAAQLEHPDSMVLVLEKKNKRKKAFLKRKTPEGDALTIYCNGRVVTRPKHGNISTVFPTTRVAHNREMLRTSGG